jgi:hypothetical protein
MKANVMNVKYLWQLAVFVAALLLLNLFFHLHISIIGSLLLTIGMSIAFNYFGRR